MKNNRTLRIVGLIVLIVIVSFITTRLFVSKSSDTQGNLAQKVLSEKVIRVGYIVYPPGLIKDPNTGQLSGIFYDALNQAGANLGVKIDWVGETTWATMLTDVQSGKFDMVGSPVWQSSPRSTQADFTIPLMYSVIGVWTRSNDHRFDTDYSGINSPNVKISVISGELAQTIAQESFPKATIVSLPQSASVSQDFLNVASNKADVTFQELPLGTDYLKSNPGSIREANPNVPLRINENVMVIPQGQPAFKEMLDTALQEELNSGYIDTLIKKYAQGEFYPVAKPYSLPQ
jgi:ABC-type amino acid transport substrate-binding protein